MFHSGHWLVVHSVVVVFGMTTIVKLTLIRTPKHKARNLKDLNLKVSSVSYVCHRHTLQVSYYTCSFNPFLKWKMDLKIDYGFFFQQHYSIKLNYAADIQQ